jgi:hypothetical protein
VADDWADPMSGATFGAPAVAPPDQINQGFWGSLVPQYLASKGLQGQYLGNLAQSLYTLPERATQSAGSLQYGGSYDPGPALESAGLVMGGTSFGAPSGAIGAGPIRAYHGSPYDFERFDINQIGTGEGAAAYGHGLYFAENPATARYYRNALAPTDVSIRLPEKQGVMPITFETANPYQKSALGEIAESNGTFEGALSGIKEKMTRYRTDSSDYLLLQHLADQIKDWQKIGAVPDVKNIGHMYEVNIRADPEQFLNWDAPIGRQSADVQRALREGWFADPTEAHATQSPSAMYAATQNELINKAWREAGQPPRTFDAPAAASAALREAGIPGIRYLDQGSRNPGFSSLTPTQLDARIEGLRADIARGGGNQEKMQSQLAGLERERESYRNQTHNYVLFRDDIIDILRKYGLAGGMVGSALPYAFAPSNAELNQ